MHVVVVGLLFLVDLANVDSVDELSEDIEKMGSLFRYLSLSLSLFLSDVLIDMCVVAPSHILMR